MIVSALIVTLRLWLHLHFWNTSQMIWADLWYRVKGGEIFHIIAFYPTWKNIPHSNLIYFWVDIYLLSMVTVNFNKDLYSVSSLPEVYRLDLSSHLNIKIPSFLVTATSLKNRNKVYCFPREIRTNVYLEIEFIFWDCTVLKFHANSLIYWGCSLS